MKRLLRVLIVEDSEDDATMLLEELRRGGFEVVHVRVQTAEAMRAALGEQTWDVVVSDYSMPQFSGIGAVSVLKATGIDVPLIIASGTIGEETAVEALKAGACDFLLKDRLARLIPAIEREMREAKGRHAQRALEVAFAETKERMQFALEAVGVGIWESELASGKTTWSGVMEQVHGLPVGGFGNSFDAFIECILPDDRQGVRDSIAQSNRDRSDSRVEYRTRWPDGSIHWIARVGRTFYSDTGEPIRAAGVGMDITAQKNLEEQYRQAQKMEAVGQLAGGIAHDFNNLLTAILGYGELLTDQIGPDLPLGRDLREITGAAQRAAAVTRQLLAFSRKQVLTVAALDLNHVVRTIDAMLRRLIGEHITITTVLAADLDAVMADATQLEQVLMNLAVNARDAMPQGGELTIRTRNASAEADDAIRDTGLWVRLSVTDTGTGMPPEIQARIFEPFFSTKERGHGTGLGLAAVHGIVTQLRGSITVESAVGHGTTFRIELPATRSAVVPLMTAAAEAPPVGAETILLVEDERSVRTFVALALKRFGYQVLEAESAESAMVLTEQDGRPIHLLLTDVVLPKMGGRDLAERLGQARPGLHVLFMSGYTEQFTTDGGFLEPGMQLLEKPFTAHALLTKVRHVLNAVVSENSTTLSP